MRETFPLCPERTIQWRGIHKYVTPERGSWRRDSQHIASVTAKFREQIRATREQAAAARAAIGPQKILFAS